MDLILAGLFEIGWPVGLKMAQVPETRWSGVGIAVAFMAVSGFLLWLAQAATFPSVLPNAVWTGIRCGWHLPRRRSLLRRSNISCAVLWRGAHCCRGHHAQARALRCGR
uniref:Uncharacterized protein n=1 Tax=Serratia marcescens TaxID=615 RepID=Q8VQN6_SERMA|nr:hypothetical protein [Serratia marcescens]